MQANMSTDTSNAPKRHSKEMHEKLGGEDAFYGKKMSQRILAILLVDWRREYLLDSPIDVDYFRDVNLLATEL